MSGRFLSTTAMFAAGLFFFAFTSVSAAREYEVGPGKALTSIAQVPWEALEAGDTVLIHWRETPYREKWVISGEGTADAPITVRGVPGPNGELPVIDGRDAVTPEQLDYWNENRSVIKVGGSNIPPDTTPTHIVIENLDIRNGRPPYKFTGRDGRAEYSRNAAAIHVQVGRDITIRNCRLHDCGNGFFAAIPEEILVEGCRIWDNGIEGSIYEHNNYTAAAGITFQFNHFGPLRTGCGGNNLKDRSAGLVVRYNWIEGGNRQLDLVDAEDREGYLARDPRYGRTFVYGNIFIEPDGAGNRQMVHYGGDSSHVEWYRKGMLLFYNNTLVSTRSDHTTAFRLSTNEEHADCRNNIFYTTAPAGRLSMLTSHGNLTLENNWLKAGYRTSLESDFDGKLQAGETNITGEEPGFVDAEAQDFHLAEGSPCIDAGSDLHPDVPARHAVRFEYVKHCRRAEREDAGRPDIGAFAHR